MIGVLRRRLKLEMHQQKTTPRPTESGPPPPSDEQLDSMTRAMPSGTVELFVEVVQPILLNHCPGAVGFALPDHKRLQLMRPPLGERPSRRITQRNLYAVLQCIDCNNPGESPLLKASVGSDAAATVGSFPGKFSSQYHRLVQWVYLVTQKPMPEEEMAAAGVDNASFTDLAGGTSTPPGLAAMNRAALRVNRGKERADPKSAAPGKAAIDREGKTKAPGGGPSDGQASRRTAGDRAAAQAIDAIDPYDPAAFNNQANAPTALATPAARVLKGDR